MRQQFYILVNKEPKPADCQEWGSWFEGADRVVAKEEVEEGVTVSTVFLGIDHNFASDGPPILFESLIFGGQFDGDMRRYATWDEALQGHKAMVEMVRNSIIVHEQEPPKQIEHKRKLRISL